MAPLDALILKQGSESVLVSLDPVHDICGIQYRALINVPVTP